MNKNIQMLISEIENNLELIYSYPAEEVRGVYEKIMNLNVQYSDDNTKRFSNGNRKEAQEQTNLEHHLEENGSTPIN